MSNSIERRLEEKIKYLEEENQSINRRMKISFNMVEVSIKRIESLEERVNELEKGDDGK